MIPHSRTTLNDIDLEAVLTPIKRGFITTGKLHEELQFKLSDFLNVKGVRLTSSGTMAFYRILNALRIKTGDEVLLPDYICNTLIDPIQILGGKVITYDNSKENWLSSPEEIMRFVSKSTKVVVVNHTFGFVFQDIKKLKDLLPKDVFIVEDCCHCLSPNRTIEKTQIGQESICSFYSFNATKYLGTGEGGAISSNDETFLEELDQYDLGDRLSDLNCGLGLSQLEQLPNFIKKRKEIADLYDVQFDKDGILNGPQSQPSLYFRYPILVEKNDKFWQSSEVAYRKGVDSLISEKLMQAPQPNALNQMSQTVSIPIYPSLTKKEIDKIISETLSLINS